MSRQIAFGYGTVQTAVLEQRVARLEDQVAVLTETVRALAAALGDQNPEDPPVAPVTSASHAR
jgi:hypothetical protein